MTNTPSTAPLGTTSGTTSNTTDLPYPQKYSLGDLGYKADVGATAHQLSGSANPTATSVTIPLGSLSPEGNILFDAKSATVVIANGATGQAITDAHLQFTDTIGGQTVTIDYPCAGIGQWTLAPGSGSLPAGVTLGSPMSIAQNTYQTFSIPLRKGMLKNAQLVLTYTSAPASGSVSAQVTLSSQFIPSYAIAPMKVASYSSTALTASGRVDLQLSGVFSRDASMRSITFFNNSTGANAAGLYVFSFDSLINQGATRQDAFSSTGSTQVATAVNNLNFLVFSDSFYSANAENQTNNPKRYADVTDGLHVELLWGTTAATGGEFEVWVSQQVR